MLQHEVGGVEVRRAVALLSMMVAVAVTPLHARAWGDAPLCVAASDEQVPTFARATDDVRRSLGFDENRNMCWSPVDSAAPNDTTEPASGGEDARLALQQAEAFAAEGRIADAVLQLRAVERALPRVKDRIALRRGELLRKSGLPEQACEAFSLATDSPDRGVAAQARIDGVYCRLEAGDRKGEAELDALLRSYPQLSPRESLQFELALARERWGNPKSAALLLRTIDLNAPGTPTGARARTELARLAETGVRVLPYSDRERVERAERLLRWAPIEQTAAEIDALLANTKLSAELRAQVLTLAARVARVQGRWQDASDIAESARQCGARGPQLRKGVPTAPPVVDEAAERAALERQIRSVRAGKTTARLGNGPLRALFEIAIGHSLKDLCDETLDAMRTRRAFSPAVRFDSAIRASGLADDVKVSALLQTLLEVPTYRVSARYHYARALERLGRLTEAEAEYTRVTTADRGSTPYYAMWADLRLWSMRSQTHETCVPLDAPMASVARSGRSANDAARSGGLLDAGVAAANDVAPNSASRALVSNAIEAAAAPGGAMRAARQTEIVQSSAELDRLDSLSGPRATFAAGQRRDDHGATEAAVERRQRVLALLGPAIERYGDAYPWLARAQDLVELELFSEAADELSETYLAWRDAKGALRMRSGLLALLTGSAPPRRPVTYALGKARRALDLPTRVMLGNAAKLLGDPGIGLRFGNERESVRPRAYADLVEVAARKYGLDPNLLFAVMRVESIYNRRIVSNVGAVGLMQIMPGTGQRIAYQLGVESFDAINLLDPQLNLEFSAWYLSSLLKRFDGRLPLAIASYNGGPHNVRLWIHRSPPNMPLDAFLERIPFSQTHTYVRRVLTYYAAYRAQQNLPMTRLSVELPQLTPDDVAF